MARLLARSPCDGLGLPIEVGQARLSEVDPGPVTAVSPFAGQAEAVGAKLGAALPAPGRTVVADGVDGADGARVLWAGPGRALVVGGKVPDLSGLASVVEQGDGIACVVLDGAGARDVLARLVPLNLLESAFPEGATARTMLNHMAVTLSRVGPEAWEIMAMRSMALTLVREVREAMEHVAARGAARGAA